MADPPDEAKELRLVNNVELKIALADTDPKLQRLLNLYLPPLLLKLASPHAAVRNKVISVCQHINTRTKPSGLLLPVAALLEQFKDPSVGGKHPLIRNFDLMYITVGIDRMPISERLELLPSLLKDISKHGNDHHQRSLFNVLLRLLPHFMPPDRGSTEDTSLRKKLGFSESPADAEWLTGWFTKLMLLNLNIFTGEGSKTCSGLSASDVEFLTLGGKKETFYPFSVLSEIKIAVLKFIASGTFTDRDRYFTVLVASTDSDSSVSEPAEDIFKRCSGVSLEDSTIVSKLYRLLLGRPGTPPAKLTLQTKVLILMTKSRCAVDSGRQSEITKIVDLSLETKYLKLQQAAFSFITWTSRMADDNLTSNLAPGVVEKLRYWLLSGPQASDELKGSAYEMLALLASRCAVILIEPQLDLIRFIFQRLENEKGTVSVSVEGALGILLTRMAKENHLPPIRTALEDLILEIISRESRAVGQAVKWSGRLLGFSNVVGRWVGIIAIGMGGAVAEEGAKAVHPYYYRLVNPEAAAAPIQDAMELDDPVEVEDKYAFPPFSPLAEYIFASQHSLPPSLGSQRLVNDTLPAKPFASALSFLKTIAIWQSLPSSLEIKPDEDWDRNVDATIFEETTRPDVEKFLIDAQQLSAVKTLLKEAWHGMTFDNEGIEGVRYIWNDLAVLVPDSIMGDFIEGLPLATKLLSAPKVETQRAAAMAVGVLGSHPRVDSSKLRDLLEKLLSAAESGSNGAVWALGFLLSRLKLRGILDRAGVECVQRASKLIVMVLADSRDGMLVDAAVEAIGEMMVFGTFSTADVDTTTIKTTLITRAKKGDEKSVLVLGYWTLLYPEDSEESRSVVEELFKIGEGGTVELSFVVGEALAGAAAGWGSSSIRKRRRIAGVDWDSGKRGGVSKLLDDLLKRASEPGGGGKRRANIISLLSLIELCSSDSAVQAKLGEAQNAFRLFLTDRDDFIQETASRGLTCIYNLSPPSEREALVRSLVSSFTGEARPRVTVTRDTQLFEPGALPTGDGSSVGSYGDIMSLASELGDPSLVYKFMTLARHNSIWASRAAFGRFGLGTILSSSEEVKNNGKLWPVLFRYRFDPNNGVRASMDNIWNALGGGQETIERWFDGIVNECLGGAVHGAEWRVREASVSALADLLAGRRLAGEYRDRLEDIWKVAFRVLDDVKESVRIAAFKLCKTLTTGMVRVVEGHETPVSEKTQILDTLMGFLMGRQGLEAEAKDVQMFSLATLLQVVKTGTPALHPFVPELLEIFLLVMSDLEPEAVNYLIMNADKYNTTGEDIDRIRLNSIRQSPIMSAIESLVDTLDAQTMQRLLPVLQKAVRTSLGLPSKVGCSRVIVNLVMRKPILVKTCADELAKTILAAVIDRSEVVSKSYAVAAGYLCRIASDQSILKVVDWAQQKYWEGEERERRAAGAVVEAVWKHATDRANSLAADILPFIFIAKSDTDPTVAEEFIGTWTDNTGGTGAVKLYLKEIVQVTAKHISSARWSTKQTCALALADAAKAIAQDVTAVQLQILWPAMVTAVGGKSWIGKEKILEAFVGLAVKGKGHLDTQKIEELQKVCIREAKRNNVTYRGSAIKCIGDFADGIESIRIFETVREIVLAAVSDEGEDAMDVDGEDGRSGKQLHQITLVNGIRAVAQAFRPSLQSDEVLKEFTEVLELLDKHISGANIGLKACSIEAVELLLNRFADAKDLPMQTPGWEKAMDRTWSRILERLKDRNYEAGRTRASKLIETFTRVIERLQTDNGLVARVKADLRVALDEEKSSIVLQVLRGAAGRVLQDG